MADKRLVTDDAAKHYDALARMDETTVLAKVTRVFLADRQARIEQAAQLAARVAQLEAIVEIANDCIGQWQPVSEKWLSLRDQFDSMTNDALAADPATALDAVREMQRALEKARQALEAPTHEANDRNCEDWPPGYGCDGCRGDRERDQAVNTVERAQAQARAVFGDPS